MKKVFLKIAFVIYSFSISLNVFAATVPFIDNGTSTDTYGLKTKYSSFTKTNVSSSNTTVTLYGKSVCSGSSCTVTYAASNNSSFKDALANAVVCTNGEKYIIYQDSGTQNHDYLSDNKLSTDGTVYWDHDFSVTCKETSSGNYSIELVSNADTTVTTENATTTSFNGTTVNNEKTGVNTYFIVLGVVAIISYVFMLCVKKYNLFKNI